MAKDCELTEADWMKAVRKQDKTDSKIDRMHERFFPQSTEELKEQEEFHADAGKSWEQVKQEVMYD
tara:strand:- start:8 stop:205 length:198 start_codon:yes stop_codon:yes gene_type:complete